METKGKMSKHKYKQFEIFKQTWIKIKTLFYFFLICTILYYINHSADKIPDNPGSPDIGYKTCKFHFHLILIFCSNCNTGTPLRGLVNENDSGNDMPLLKVENEMVNKSF